MNASTPAEVESRDPDIPRVLVTGASGFVGEAIVRRLAGDSAFRVRAAFRSRTPALPAEVEAVHVGDIGEATDWSVALRGVELVVHAAARVHVVREKARDPLVEFRAVNVAGTIALATQAARAGVRRFVFISSIKVNGEETSPEYPFNAKSPPAPADAYGISKHEAERALARFAQESRMQVVVIRPVLVYGPGVKANFRAMLRAIRRGVPLPLKAIRNRRSLVALDTLVDLVVRCLWHPQAAGQTFLVSDGEDLSTPELLRRAAMIMDRPARLVAVPAGLLGAVATLLRRRAVLRRVTGSLTVDMSATRDRLDWTPPVSLDDALRKTIAAFLLDESRQ